MYNSFATNWQKKKNSKTHFAHKFLEKPAMWGKLPDLKGKNVLCLGCGSGEECDYLSKLGAKVTGIDISPELIDLAKKQFPSLEFMAQDIAKLELGNQKFDFVYSSLCLHYVENWQECLENLKPSLNQNAKMLFSVHHPIKWGAKSIRKKEGNSFVMGYKKDKINPERYKIYGDYLTSRAIEDKLFGKLEIIHYHKSISEMLRQIRSANYQLLDLLEPKPTLESEQVKPDFFAVYSKIPLFLILEITPN